MSAARAPSASTGRALKGWRTCAPSLRGEFVEVSPPSRLVFTWGFENESVDVAPGASTGPREGLEPAVGLRGQRVIFTSGLRGR